MKTKQESCFKKSEKKNCRRISKIIYFKIIYILYSESESWASNVVKDVFHVVD